MLLRSAQESKVRLTFTDIWRDYKNYRNAYYFHKVIPTPREIVQKELEKDPVPPLDKFSLWQTLKWLIANRQAHESLSPNDIFCKMLYITILLVFGKVIAVQKRWYYNWKDPLVN